MTLIQRINDLATAIATHFSNYYKKTEVDAIISGLSSGGSNVVQKEITLNLNSNDSKNFLNLTVTDTSILSTSKILDIYYSPKNTTNLGIKVESIDDDEFDDLVIKIKNINNGTFNINLFSKNGKIKGYKTLKYNVIY